MSRRRSLLYKVGESVPATFFKPEDLPTVNAVYGLFETKKGNQYLVAINDVEKSYFTDYTFIAPVVAWLRGSGGYAVFLVSGAPINGRYRTVSTAAIITPGVLAPTTAATSINDYMGKADAEQTRTYYVDVAGRAETELEIYLRCKDIICNGQECYPASMGEVEAVRIFLTQINALLRDAGKTAIIATNAMASYTVSGSSASYIWRKSTLGTTGQNTTQAKNGSTYFLPITELDVQFNNPEIKPSYMDIDPVNLSTTYLWVEDEEGWWTAPKINVSSGNSSLRFNISNQYAGSRVRVHVEFESLTAASVTLYALNAGTTYLNIAARTIPVSMSYDYVLPTVTDTAYFNVGYRRTSSAADVNNVRIRVEQIDSQAEDLPAMTITQQGNWTLQENGYMKSPIVGANQAVEQRILVTTTRNNQKVRITGYVEGGNATYDYLHVGKLDTEWGSAGQWSARLDLSNAIEQMPYMIDIDIPTKGDHFIVMRQFSGTGEAFSYFKVEDAKGLDAIPDIQYYVEGDWTLNNDGYCESPAIGHNEKTEAKIWTINRAGTRKDLTVAFYASSEVNDILYIGYDNNEYSATDQDSGTNYSASNPKTTSFRVPAYEKAFKKIWYQKNWNFTEGNDKGYFKLIE